MPALLARKFRAPPLSIKLAVGSKLRLEKFIEIETAPSLREIQVRHLSVQHRPSPRRAVNGG